MKNKDWSRDFAPQNMAQPEEFSAKSICLSVESKLENEKGHITMTKHKKIRPLLICAAVAAVTAASMVTVNATTDGAVMDKIRLFINGEEQEYDAHCVESGISSDGTEYITYETDADESNGVSVEYSAIAGEDSETDSSSVSQAE